MYGTTSETVLYSFGSKSPDGAEPTCKTVERRRDALRNHPFGGAYSKGSVFTVATSGQEAVLYSFKALAPVAPTVKPHSAASSTSMVSYTGRRRRVPIAGAPTSTDAAPSFRSHPADSPMASPITRERSHRTVQAVSARSSAIGKPLQYQIFKETSNWPGPRGTLRVPLGQAASTVDRFAQDRLAKCHATFGVARLSSIATATPPRAKPHGAEAPPRRSAAPRRRTTRSGRSRRRALRLVGCSERRGNGTVAIVDGRSGAVL